MNKVAMLARCVHASVQKHGNSLTKADLATAAAGCHICHHQRPKLSPRCSTIHWSDQPAIHWRASSMGKKTFCSYWSRYLFWLCICLSYTWSFWPNYNLWPYKVTYPLSWYSTQYVFWPRNTFHTQRIATAGPHDHGIHWSYHVLHHPKAAGQIEIWNGLLKTQLQCQLSSSSLEGWGRVLQKTVYTLSQHPV